MEIHVFLLRRFLYIRNELMRPPTFRDCPSNNYPILVLSFAKPRIVASFGKWSAPLYMIFQNRGSSTDPYGTLALALWGRHLPDIGEFSLKGNVPLIRLQMTEFKAEFTLSLARFTIMIRECTESELLLFPLMRNIRPFKHVWKLFLNKLGLLFSTSFISNFIQYWALIS